jgi:hypothetical protein
MAECQLHTVRFEDDCEFCHVDKTQAVAELDALMTSNNKLMKELAGKGAFLDQATFVDLRLNMLLQSLYGQKQLLRFERAFHEQVTEMLEDVSSEMSKKKLLPGNLLPFDPKKGIR